jgi:glutamate--cysteine ligase
MAVRGGASAGAAAFWVGLLYDDESARCGLGLVKGWTADERQALRDDVPVQGFAATIRNRNMLSLADETLKLTRAGLARRRRLNPGGEDETKYLVPLEDLVARGETPAEELLAKYHGPWGGSVEPVFDEYAY